MPILIRAEALWHNCRRKETIIFTTKENFKDQVSKIKMVRQAHHPELCRRITRSRRTARTSLILTFCTLILALVAEPVLAAKSNKKSSSSGRSPFKNTPLYKHIVKRRNTESVRLYEKESITSGKHEEVAGKLSDEKIKHAKEIKGGGLEKSRRGPVAKRRLDNLMDPSTFKRDMPFSEAIDILRNSTSPKLNIVVLWKDLEENADIYTDTPIGIDGVTGVSLNRHLKSLLDGVSGGSQER